MAANHQPLFLHEEIMLLALRDETGVMESGAWYSFAMGGAILSELLLAGRVEIDGGKKPLVDLLNRDPLGCEVLNECLAKVAAAKRRASPQTWVSRFANLNQLRHRVAMGLCDRRILRNDVGTVLLVFKRKVYPEINPRPEKELIERLRKAIFSDARTVDPRTTILVALAGAGDLLKISFDRKELKRRKDRIDRMIDGDLAGKATKQAVSAAQAAVAMGAVIST
jgi:hypothetical protein